MPQCRIKSSHVRGIYIAVVAGESLEQLHILEQEDTHPCKFAAMKYKTLLCNKEILPCLWQKFPLCHGTPTTNQNHIIR